MTAGGGAAASRTVRTDHLPPIREASPSRRGRGRGPGAVDWFRRRYHARKSWDVEQAGEYRICFAVAGRPGWRHIAFSVHQQDKPPGRKVAKTEQVPKIWDKYMRLTDVVDRIKDQLDYMAMAEEHQAEVNARMDSHVLYWAIFEALAVLTVTCFQVSRPCTLSTTSDVALVAGSRLDGLRLGAMWPKQCALLAYTGLPRTPSSRLGCVIRCMSSVASLLASICCVVGCTAHCPGVVHQALL